MVLQSTTPRPASHSAALHPHDLTQVALRRERAQATSRRCFASEVPTKEIAVWQILITVFLAFRMCQAVIVTAMVLSRAVVRDMVPQDQAASMIGYVTMGVAVVPMIGPVIGGVLDEIFGWQSTFWMLFLLGAVILWMSWRDLGETSVSPTCAPQA